MDINSEFFSLATSHKLITQGNDLSDSVHKLGNLPETWPQGLSVQDAVLCGGEPSAAQASWMLW